MKYGNYDNWKLDNPYENEVESYESEKFGYWHMNDTLVMKFNDLIEAYKGNDLEDMKAVATPIEELNLLKKPEVSLTGIETINGTEAYALKNGKTTLYYDVKSGLKIADVITIEQGGKTMNKTNSYLDYREVKGVKVPFNMIQNVGFELNIKMTDVKINEGVTDADFQ